MKTKKTCGLHCLRLNNITVEVGDFTLVDDVSLHVHCGELAAIVGRNGTGKSTLLKALLGQMPHKGTVKFSGHSENDEVRRPVIGYVPQSISLDSQSPATVFDVFMSLTSKWPIFLPSRKKDRDKVASHLAKFESDTLIDKPAGRLSGGELQRVLLAIAMLPKPDLLVLDEPVSGVDQAGLSTFYEILNHLKSNSDVVMLMVSHDFDFVNQYADRVLLLNKKVLDYGTPTQVFSGKQFKSQFPNVLINTL